jgi:hypothetical protein
MGTGTGTNLYPPVGMGFLPGTFHFRGYEFGFAVPSGNVPVAISTLVSLLHCNYISSSTSLHFHIALSLILIL